MVMAASACLIFAGAPGCVQSDFSSAVNYRWLPDMRPARQAPPSRNVRPATVEQPPKQIESSEDYRERHPSMWKRKLRAMYASA